MTTKTEAAAMVASGLHMETFHHSTLGHFNITLLRVMIQATNQLYPGRLKLHFCRFDQMQMVDSVKADAFDYLTANREIDPDRVSSLTAEQIDEPLIFLKVPAGLNGDQESDLLVDGIHRLCRRKREGLKSFEFYIVPMFLCPVVEDGDGAMIPWGEKEVVPGVGLVRRKP